MVKNKRRRWRAGFHPLRFLFGYSRISFEKKQLESALNLLKEEGIECGEIELFDAEAELGVPFFSVGRLERAVAERGLTILSREDFGIPALVIRHKARLGVPIGVLVALMIFYFSGTVIWDIRIDGEDRLSESYVKGVLEECGLSVGTAKRGIDAAVIENRALILSDDIAWISVNVIGTVAKVEIRELVEFYEEEKEEKMPPCDLVAERGGVIVGLEGVKGNIAVKVGDVVEEGALLVGGRYGDEETGFRYMTAEGEVMAEVDRSFSVRVPRKYQKKSYTGEVKYEKYLIFFEKEVKFFGNSGNLYPLYDKIDTVEYMRSPNGEILPVGIRTVRYLEYSYTEQTRSDSELSQIAKYRIELEIAALGRELRRKSYGFLLDADGYTLTCDIRTVENIARAQELIINTD